MSKDHPRLEIPSSGNLPIHDAMQLIIDWQQKLANSDDGIVLNELVADMQKAIWLLAMGIKEHKH